MRLLLWVLLVTLVTLLASTDAASSTIANAETTKTSELESIRSPALPARALSLADGKRSLRIHANDDATDNEDVGESYMDEERAISISSTFHRLKISVGKWTNGLADALNKRLNRFSESMAMRLYNMGETPVSIRAKFMGSGRNNKGVTLYKEWYDKNVATGVIKALD